MMNDKRRRERMRCTEEYMRGKSGGGLAERERERERERESMRVQYTVHCT